MSETPTRHSFPKLAELLKKLKSGRSQFGEWDIYDYLRGRDDEKFRDRAKKQHPIFRPAIEELKATSADLPHPPDEGQIRFLLWRSLSPRTSSAGRWDACKIGEEIVARLRSLEQDRLIFIPLREAMAPLSAAPAVHQVGESIWVFEPAQTKEQLLSMVNAVLGITPTGLPEVIGGIGDPTRSEFGSLLLDPQLVFRTGGSFSEREYRLKRYGIPLLALKNIVTVNNLDTSDSLGIWGYMTKNGIAGWSSELQSEWKERCDTESAWGKSLFGMFEPHFLISMSDGSKNVGSYEMPVATGSVHPGLWAGSSPPSFPPILILPSLLSHTDTSDLFDLGDRLASPAATDLDRRIGHATRMWSKACQSAQEEEWEFGYEEGHEVAHTPDPDSLILYSTIVLETLFSTKSDKAELTSRISDFTAALLGKSAEQRYEIAKAIKKSYGQRSNFVHGGTERLEEYETAALWLFKLATLALWETVRLRMTESAAFPDWNAYEQYLIRRKYGAM